MLVFKLPWFVQQPENILLIDPDDDVNIKVISYLTVLSRLHYFSPRRYHALTVMGRLGPPASNSVVYLFKPLSATGF